MKTIKRELFTCSICLSQLYDEDQIKTCEKRGDGHLYPKGTAIEFKSARRSVTSPERWQQGIVSGVNFQNSSHKPRYFIKVSDDVANTLGMEGSAIIGLLEEKDMRHIGEGTIYPRWEEICRIPDSVFMMGVALLDLDSDFGRVVAVRFPDYFTDERPENVGPIPLSVLRREGSRQFTEDWNSPCSPEEMATLVTDQACEKFEIPYISYHGSAPDKDFERESCPQKIIRELEELKEKQSNIIGCIVEINSKQLVVVEDNLPDNFYVAPAQCIDVSC